jgi:hypothetical protein
VGDRSWPRPGDGWYGTVHAAEGETEGRGGHFVVASHLWPLGEVPPVGTLVEVRVVGRSPYWALVDDEEAPARPPAAKPRTAAQDRARPGSSARGETSCD